MDNPFIKYKPENGSWSGYPKGVQPTDKVDVIFSDSTRILKGFAYEFGWNTSDISKYRKT